MRYPVGQVVWAAYALFVIQPTASAQSTCDRLRTVEATGIVLDSDSYRFAADRWSTDPATIPLFTYETVQIAEGGTIWGIMSGTPFLPDKYNLEVVAALNPSITDLSDLNAGQSVSFPSYITYEQNLVDGFKFWPALAAEWSDTAAVVETLDDASQLIVKYASLHDAGIAWEQVISLIDSATVLVSSTSVESFADIEKVISAYQGANIVSNLVQDATVAGSDLDPAAVFAVAYSAAGRVGAPRVNMVVRTYSPSNERIDGLRLFRLSRFDNQFECWQNKIEFRTRSFEAEATVTAGNWVIWAEDEDGRRSRRRTLSREMITMPIDYTIEWE